MLTTFGLIGTGAHQAGFFDIESEPTSVVCAHDNHDNPIWHFTAPFSFVRFPYSML
jgi:hypothetical protein